MQQSEEIQVHLAGDDGQHGQARRPTGSTATIILAAFAAAFGFSLPRVPQRKARKPDPCMVCSPPEEIAEWNAGVQKRREQRAQFARRDAAAAYRGQFKGTGQYPKLAKPRVHKQHRHPLHDEHGAYTLVGLPHPLTGKRRMWLAGISAQRGF